MFYSCRVFRVCLRSPESPAQEAAADWRAPWCVFFVFFEDRKPVGIEFIAESEKPWPAINISHDPDHADGGVFLQVFNAAVQPVATDPHALLLTRPQLFVHASRRLIPSSARPLHVAL